MSRPYVTPTSVYVGHKLIYVSDQESLAQVLGRYRDNLVAHNYVETRFENLSETIIGPKAVRVTLDWIDLNGQGEVINEKRATFYCQRAPVSGWEVSLLSISEELPPDLMAGIPSL
ncbi:MAG: hypothetical protein P1U53_12255 [Sulfitobacter sp.]|nr:hypothetical protein [Sulfitobacter sp.]